MIKIILLIVLLTIFSGRNFVYGQVETACLGVPDNNFVNSPRSCAHFYFCDNEEALEGNCPDEWVFNPTTQGCDSAANVDCLTCSPFGIQHLPVEGSCTRFVRCEQGVSTHMQCPIGLHFFRAVGWCFEEGDCESYEETDPPTTTEGTTTEPETTTTTSTTTPTVGPPTPTPPSMEGAPDCSQTTQVFHANPFDCQRYFMCINGQAIPSACVDGLWWNQFSIHCNFPENTVCVQLHNPQNV